MVGESLDLLCLDLVGSSLTSYVNIGRHSQCIY